MATRSSLPGATEKYGVMVSMPETMPVKNILIADDDDALLFAFKRIFRDEGVTIHAAGTIEGAQRVLDNYPIELVIVDLWFSDTHPEGGFEIIRYAREKTPGIKTVLWTAFSESDFHDHTGSMGIDYILNKPVPSDEIRRILQKTGILA